MNNNSQKKYKRPKQITLATTNPDCPRVPPLRDRDNEDRSECPEHVCPLLAKDSEWVDIVQSPFPNAPAPSSSSVGDEEALLQLVDCEDGPQSEPLAIMFPGLLEQDPQTFEGMLTKAMSTTEVTRHLVDLGAKANFQFMKKSNKLIPRDKQWLEKVTESENNNSHCSLDSNSIGSSPSSEYEADNENTLDELLAKRKKRKLLSKSVKDEDEVASSSTDTIIPNTQSKHNKSNQGILSCPLLNIGQRDRSIATCIQRDPALRTRSSVHLVGGRPTLRLVVRVWRSQ